MGAIFQGANRSVTYSLRDSDRYCKVNPPFSNTRKKPKKKRAAPRNPVPYVKRGNKLELY